MFWKLNGFHTKTFYHETKMSHQNRVIPLFSKFFFKLEKLFETQKCAPTKLITTVRQQTFDVKSWYSFPFPFVTKKLIDTRSILENERFPYENYLPWVKNESSKSCYPPPVIQKFFNFTTFPKHRSVPQQKLSLLWDNKLSTLNRDTPFLSHS